MSDIAQQDIAYQPATKAYAFSTSPSAPDNSKLPRKPMSWKPFFLFLGVIASLTLVFLIFLGVLNYLNLISLPPFLGRTLPKQPPKILPKISTNYDQYQKLTFYTLEGTLYGYDNYTIKIRSGSEILSLQFDPNQSSFKKELTSTLQVSSLLTELENKNNLGKPANVEFVKNGNNMIIRTIILNK